MVWEGLGGGFGGGEGGSSFDMLISGALRTDIFDLAFPDRTAPKLLLEIPLLKSFATIAILPFSDILFLYILLPFFQRTDSNSPTKEVKASSLPSKKAMTCLAGQNATSRNASGKYGDLLSCRGVPIRIDISLAAGENG